MNYSFPGSWDIRKLKAIIIIASNKKCFPPRLDIDEDRRIWHLCRLKVNSSSFVLL